MGEYINLMVAMQRSDGDAPQVVVDRYGTDQPQVNVTFNVHATTAWGQDVYLVGDHPLLSDWIPEAAIKMSPAAYPTWSVKMSLPASTIFHYKFVKRGAGMTVWESGADRSLTTPGTGDVTVSNSFR
jgi:glucoamylase